MKSLWNIRHPRDKIKGHEPKEIWDELKLKWVIHVIENLVGYAKIL